MKNSKLIGLFLVLTIFFSPTLAKKAEAQWVTIDLTQAAKEYGLDSVAFIIANAAIQRLAASTVNWINNGFNGNPAFVTNPEQFFGNLADGIAGQLIYKNDNFKFMCSDFSAKVRLALGQSYRSNNSQNFQCTLTGVVNNFDNFINDFNQGGWDGFIEITQNSQNNPIGLYNSWNSEILNKQNDALQQKQNELNQGRGFLSFKTCVGNQGRDPDGFCIDGEETSTPGSVIQGQLDKVLGSGTGRLEVADELNEIISALLNQLMSKALGGLRSLSSPGAGSAPAYDSQLGNDAPTQALGSNPDNQAINSQFSCTLPNGQPGIKSGTTCIADPSQGTGSFSSCTQGPNGQCFEENDLCPLTDGSGNTGLWVNGACLAVEGTP